MTHDPTVQHDELIAVIGMAGRFPGANSVEDLWANLCNEVESISVLQDQLDADQPDFIPAYGMLSEASEFDAGYFGYGPHQALIIDPQQRILLECAHDALERAGHGGPNRPVTGVFVGGSQTGYATAVRDQLDHLPFIDEWQLRHATSVDFMATRIAYHLDLSGPAVTVQTACSSSLVAVHTAIDSLLAGGCEMAVAGGASVLAHLPTLRYTPGGIIAADGHCRAFDAAATGTVAGDAVGLVVLRPLADAVTDGDWIHAVIRGSAINNDGRNKVGFTAPSVTGQAHVIRSALSLAGVEADQIGYVEAHGTGTALGDPVEISALTRTFRESTDRVGYCRIGSVKSNIGHTDAAAGVVGLIKTVLTVEHGLIPASLHFEKPNPAIDFESSPFRVNETTRPWRTEEGPRIACVSGFGVGGTNAHVVVGQAPEPAEFSPGRSQQLVVMSAKTDTAADTAVGRLAAELAARPDTDLPDAAWTMAMGRTHHRHRRFVVAAGCADAVRALSSTARHGDTVKNHCPETVLIFAGQGGQHVGMANSLYREEPVYRRHLDEVASLASGPLGIDLREVLYPKDERMRSVAEERMATIAIGQPAVFCVQYATAMLLASWNIRPKAVASHSLGAYAAACVAGVFSLPDAVRLVVERGRLLGQLPEGAMAAVSLAESELESILPQKLSIAAVNGSGQCTVSGPAELITSFARDLAARSVEARVLRIATAGHSAVVEPILRPFEDFVASLRINSPVIPMVSDSTGEWVDPEEVRTAAYWTQHLRQPVRFDAVLSTLFTAPNRALVDIGPGRAVSTLAQQHPGRKADHLIVHATPHPAEGVDDLATLLAAAGKLWAAGSDVDLSAMYAGETRRRLPLPTYPFERDRFLVPSRAEGRKLAPDGKAGKAADWITNVAREATAQPSAGQSNDIPPIVEAIRKSFEAALGVPDVDPEDGLFDLGGDSLLAIRLAAWAVSEFDVPVSGADIIKEQTANAIGTLIETRISEASL